MPMQRIAFQRRRVGAAVQLRRPSYRIDALASLSTCFFAPRFSAPSHVLWPLIPRSAGHTPAIPTPFFAPPSPVDAVLFRCNFSLCRAFPSQSTALPLLIAAVPQQIEASPLQIRAPRSRSIARLVFSQRTVQLPSPPFRRSSARCTPMQFLGHSRHCHAAA